MGNEIIKKEIKNNINTQKEAFFIGITNVL